MSGFTHVLSATVALGVLSFALPAAKAALVPGSIMFTGFDAASGTGQGSDQFAFVTLSNIAAGEQIYFRDDEWSSTTSAFAGTGEGELLWTAPTGGVAAGRVIVVNSTAVTTTLGSIADTATTSDNTLNLSTGGEGIYAYQGSGNTPTTFLSLIRTESANNVPTSIADYTVTLTNSIDVGQYTGSRNDKSTFAGYASSIATVSGASWSQLEGSTAIPAETNFNTTSFVVPEPTSFAALGLAGLALLRRRGRV